MAAGETSESVAQMTVIMARSLGEELGDWEDLFLAAFIAASAYLCPELEEFVAEGFASLLSEVSDG